MSRRPIQRRSIRDDTVRRVVLVPRAKRKPEAGFRFEPGENATEKYEAIAVEIFALVRNSARMKHWRQQVKSALRDIPEDGKSRPIENLPDVYLCLAGVHDFHGALRDIITKEVWAKWPRGYVIDYGAGRCGVHLAIVKADLEERGLLRKEKGPTKPAAEPSGLTVDQQPSEDETTIEQAKKAKPMLAEKRAWESYKWVCKKHSELVPEDQRYTKDMYEKAIEESGFYHNEERTKLLWKPSFDSWARNIRGYVHKQPKPEDQPNQSQEARDREPDRNIDPRSISSNYDTRKV